MSYILDALRKSERERSLGTVPDLGTVQQERRVVHTSRWSWVAGVLLVLNIAIGIAFFMKEPANVVVAESDEMSVPVSAIPVAPAVPAKVEDQAVPAQEHGQTKLAVPNETLLPSNVNNSEPPKTSLAKVETLEMPPARSTPGQAESLAGTPSDYSPEPSPGASDWMDMPADFRARVSRPDIDVHVYSNQPARRFVLIDLQKYREGERTDSGLEIESITQSGVIFSDHGTRFQVKRP